MSESQVQPFDYIAEANSTLSNKFHGELVSFSTFDDTLWKAIDALKALDAIKKTLYYGKELPLHLQAGEIGTYKDCMGLPDWFKNQSFGETVIHGAIGAATESGEMLEAIYRVIVYAQTFDEVNAKEETGDAFWYLAVLAKSCGFSFEEAQRVNIAKLRAKNGGRYANGFSEEAALNRDLLQERRILESDDDILGEDQ